MPPPTPLTRFKKDVAAKQAGVVARRSRGPRLADQSRCGEVDELTTTSLCVRLNTLSVRGDEKDGCHRIRIGWILGFLKVRWGPRITKSLFLSSC